MHGSTLAIPDNNIMNNSTFNDCRVFKEDSYRHIHLQDNLMASCYLLSIITVMISILQGAYQILKQTPSVEVTPVALKNGFGWVLFASLDMVTTWIIVKFLFIWILLLVLGIFIELLMAVYHCTSKKLFVKE